MALQSSDLPESSCGGQGGARPGGSGDEKLEGQIPLWEILEQGQEKEANGQKGEEGGGFRGRAPREGLSGRKASPGGNPSPPCPEPVEEQTEHWFQVLCTPCGMSGDSKSVPE